MTNTKPVHRNPAINRRAFLRGAGGVAIGLPFFESIPMRSAWSQGNEPLFAFFIGTACGVVQESFWPTEQGALTDLSKDTNAAGALAGFEPWLAFLQGFNGAGSSTSSSHVRGMVTMFTGGPADDGEDVAAMAVGPSIDIVLAPYLNPDAAEPLTLYSGLKSGYIDERLSFDLDGQVRLAEGNPYKVYLDLMGAASMAGNLGTTTDTDERLTELMARRGSAIDLVRDDLQALLGRTNINDADRQRLELHLSSLRDLEAGLTDLPVELGTTCSASRLDVDAIEASGANDLYRTNGQVEIVAELQMQLAAFAFACNLNHVATLQIGDGLDGTVYDVPSNARGWRFHHISHRIQDDGRVGNDPLAEQAHAEIDRLRLSTFRRGLAKFDEHGLLGHSIGMWTNHIADGPSGRLNNVPIIVAGNAGGSFRTGYHLVPEGASILAGVLNSRLLTTIAYALGVDETIGIDGELMTELLV